MKSTRIAFALVGAFLMLAPSLAQAQATRTWISGVGDDVNPCSRTAPCKTFPGAISKTAAGGEIDTLDPGGFGGVTVTKAITLANEGIGEAGILVAGTNGVTVNCATDPNCVVILRGLQIDGGPIGSNSLNGVRFVAGRALFVQNCTIRNFTGGSPNGYGIQFNPSSGNASLFVENSVIVNNGVGGVGTGTGGNIFILPSGSPTVNVSVVNSQTSLGNAGVRSDSSSMSGGSITTSISNTEVSGNINGGLAVINNAGNNIANTMIVADSNITGNNVGINANGGANSILRIGTSKLTFNATGYKQAGTAVITSYGNNLISDNGTNTGTLGSLGPS